MYIRTCPHATFCMVGSYELDKLSQDQNALHLADGPLASHLYVTSILLRIETIQVYFCVRNHFIAFGTNTINCQTSARRLLVEVLARRHPAPNELVPIDVGARVDLTWIYAFF